MEINFSELIPNKHLQIHLDIRIVYRNIFGCNLSWGLNKVVFEITLETWLFIRNEIHFR